MAKFLLGIFLCCIFIFGLSFAQNEKGSILLPESALYDIHVKLDKLLNRVGQEGQKDILEKLNQILAGQAEIKEQLNILKIRVMTR